MEEKIKLFNDEIRDYAVELEQNYKNIDEKNCSKYEQSKILDELKELKNKVDIDEWAKPYWLELNQNPDSFFKQQAQEALRSIVRIKEKITNLENIKNELNKKSEPNENNYKVGDILVNSWGYDQTNIDFYQIISTTKKSIKITEIGAKLDKEHSNSYEDALKPNKGSFLGKEITITRSKSPKLKGYYFLHKAEEDEIFYETSSYCKR